MKHFAEIFVVLCVIVLGCMLVLPSVLAYRVLRGQALVLSRSGMLEVAVNGRNVRVPSFRVDRDSVSPTLRGLHAFRLGTENEKTVVWIEGGGVDGAYWLSEKQVGVTRRSFGAVCFFGRWLVLSEVALNQTYDVRHDMKGLGANLAVVPDDGGTWYEWNFKKRGRTFSVKLLCPSCSKTFPKHDHDE